MAGVPTKVSSARVKAPALDTTRSAPPNNKSIFSAYSISLIFDLPLKPFSSSSLFTSS